MAPPTAHTASMLLLLAVCSLIVQQAIAMPMHPDMLTFAKLPIAADPSEELQQTAARTLQQAYGGANTNSNGDLFREGGGPFTFDGFGFGYSGLFPGGGFFDGFGVNIYNIIFRDILNEGLNQYLANAITNNPLQPFDFIPPTIGNRFNRDVVSLFGYDAVDKYIEQYLTRAEAKLGELIDAGCVGPTYSVTVNGGECEINDDGSVECEPPSITLSSTPYICNLPYRTAAKLEGQSVGYKIKFGRERKGELGLPASLYDFGAAVNVTTPYLGVSLQTARILNDFGVQQWYQFLGNFVLNELLRIQAALLTGAVDSRILTTAAQDQANAAAAAGGNGTTGGNGTSVARGVAAVRDAGSLLLDKIAASMGILTDDLSAGLHAAGVLPKTAAAAAQPDAAQQAQQQAKKQAQLQQQRSGVKGDTIVPNVDAAADKGGKVMTSNTQFKQGDVALLDEPLVKKAEGAQPEAGVKYAKTKTAAQEPAAQAAKPKKKAAKKP